MDALAASVGLAAASAQRVTVGARVRPSAAMRRAARPAGARPLYRGEDDLDSALGDGAAGAAVLHATGPRFPLPSMQAILLMVVVATALLAAPVLAQIARLTPFAGQPATQAVTTARPASDTPATTDAPAAEPVTATEGHAAAIVLEADYPGPAMPGPEPSLARDGAATSSTTAAAPAALPTATGAATARPDAAAVATPAATSSAAATTATAASQPVQLLSQTTTLADVSSTGTPASTPKQLIAGGGKLYLLDPYANTLFLIDQSGKAPTPLLTSGWTIAKTKVTDLLGATWRGDTLVVMDRQRAYTLDGPGGTWRATPLAAGGLGAGVHPVAAFSRNLYVLDNAKKQVLKFTQGAYARAPQPWLTLNQNVDLAGAVDLAIDGRIYVLTASGHLLHLYQGALEKTTTLDVTPAVARPAALVSPPESDYLYMAESGGRILKLTKDGRVVGQLHLSVASEQAPLSNLWVDEANQTLIAIVGNRVVKTRLAAS
jgi:hypothetical protein